MIKILIFFYLSRLSISIRGKACFLNFHKTWKRNFTGVIFASDFNKFPFNPEDYYLGKEVTVTGIIKEYQGKPEIIVKNPNQIEIMKQKIIEASGSQRTQALASRLCE